MNAVLRSLVDRLGGVVTRAVAAQVVPATALDAACRASDLLRVLPEVYVDARCFLGDPVIGGSTSGRRSGRRPTSGSPTVGGAASGCPSTGRPKAGYPTCGLPAPGELLARLDPALRRRVLAAYADGRGALSHTTALAVWGVCPEAVGEPLHLSVPAASGIRSRPGLVVHQRTGFRVEPPQVVLRRGMPLIRLEQSLVDSWPLLSGEQRRAPVIRAVNDRMTTPERLRQTLDEAPKLPGRTELCDLLHLLAIGCRSPLEIWGHERVFVGPGMPLFQRQVRITIGRRTVYLDLYAERERVNIELDGASTHGDPREREIDVRRDALLATLGIQVVRFTHRRLMHEPAEVRRELLAILAARRAA